MHTRHKGLHSLKTAKCSRRIAVSKFSCPRQVITKQSITSCLYLDPVVGFNARANSDDTILKLVWGASKSSKKSRNADCCAYAGFVRRRLVL